MEFAVVLIAAEAGGTLSPLPMMVPLGTALLPALLVRFPRGAPVAGTVAGDESGKNLPHPKP